MSWIRQAAEYLVRALRGSSSGTGPDVVQQGRDLHSKLVAKHNTQYDKKVGAASPGEYPRRRSGALQKSLETTIYKEGGKYLVNQRVNLDLLFEHATHVIPVTPGSYPGLLYNRGYKGPVDNLRDENLNVTDADNFRSPPTNIEGVTVMFTKAGP